MAQGDLDRSDANALGRATSDVRSSTPTRALRTLLLGVVLGVVGVAVAGVVVGGPLAVGHRMDLPMELVYGQAVVSWAARLNAGSQTNPVAQNARAVVTGRNAYTGSCAQCHGADGKGKGVFGSLIYPPATDLTGENASEKSDAELFWIVKNGLSFTGMPGFGHQYADSDIWSMVSFMRAMQNGQSGAVAVPTPTAEQFALADPTGDPTQRGAAVYFAQACDACHGAVGNAPDGLGLREGGKEGAQAVRRGRRGMPAYGTDLISDNQLTDLEAYMSTFAGQQQGLRPGQFQLTPAN